jgi:Iap family predicted aminopeptidase
MILNNDSQTVNLKQKRFLDRWETKMHRLEIESQKNVNLALPYRILIRVQARGKFIANSGDAIRVFSTIGKKQQMNEKLK